MDAFADASSQALGGPAGTYQKRGARGVIRVLVADDHLAVRECVRTLLATEREITIVVEADDGSTALALARSLRPDLIVRRDSMRGSGSRELARSRLAALC